MSEDSPNTFKVVQLNAENLFLFLDEPVRRDWRRLSEKEWQKLSAATTPNKPLGKVLWLADSLLELDADIVCLNEVGGLESIQNFAKFFLEERYVPYLIEGNSDRGIDIGYLVRRAFPGQVELRTHKDRPLNFLYPHEAQGNLYFEGLAPEKMLRTHYFSRDCAELRLYTRGVDRPSLILLLVHLKSKLDPDGIDPEGRARRQAELKTLVNIYNEVRGEFSPPVPMIVTGDFNGCARLDQPDPEFKELSATDLTSVADVAGLNGDSAATQVVFSRTGQIHPMQIDYMFVSPELRAELIPSSIGVFRYRSDLRVPLPLPKTLEQRTFLPSDHYPVVATFNDFLRPR